MASQNEFSTISSVFTEGLAEMLFLFLMLLMITTFITKTNIAENSLSLTKAMPLANMTFKIMVVIAIRKRILVKECNLNPLLILSNLTKPETIH